MQYILFARTIGLCAQEALRQSGLGDDRPCLIHSGGAVIDLNAAALARKATLGMPLKEAKTILRGDALCVEYVPEKFEPARDGWLEPFLVYSNLVQAGRAGEALADLAGHPDPVGIASLLLGDVYRGTGLPLLAGLAPSAWLARASARPCNPSALRLGIPAFEPVEDPAAWLAPQPVGNLLPVDSKDRKRLRDLGFDRISQVQLVDPSVLERQFPRRGVLIHLAAMGRLADPIQPNYPPGTLAECRHLGGVVGRLEVDEALRSLCGRLVARLNRADQEAKSVLLAVGFEGGRASRIQRNLAKPLASASQLAVVAGHMFGEAAICEPVEFLHLSLSDLRSAQRRQMLLALGMGDSHAKRHLSEALERVNLAHGTRAVIPASSVVLDFNQQVLKEWKRATGWR
ncbi:MAG: hypothetical protein JSS71_04960 [Armatimonadetes bacterium]|nr:hypothetical protein [Armatimonadota bacterium]MBX3108733.1 hypothetical protein [Fimbriimonadaceae bacterium]